MPKILSLSERGNYSILGAMLDFAKFQFHPVIQLPQDYEVYDFTAGYDENRQRSSPYGVGKYNERRKGMYMSELFANRRDIHVGIDLAGPLGEPVHAFFAGRILHLGYNSAPGDYGYTLVTEHELNDQILYALFGHLSAASLQDKSPGQSFAKGEVIAWLGDKNENGGWNPHVHFQLSLVRPTGPDLPGAVNEANLQEALKIYPDPRLVLGPIY